MEITDIRDAGSQLPRLVDRAILGEEILIAEAGTPVVRLVPVRPDDAPRRGGQWKGRVRMADDFDALPDDLASAFGIEPA